MMRSRMMHLEASKKTAQDEVSTMKRRLEQSEGGREALAKQIGEQTSSQFIHAL